MALYEKIRAIRGMKNIPDEIKSHAVACLDESPQLEILEALSLGKERLQKFLQSQKQYEEWSPSAL